MHMFAVADINRTGSFSTKFMKVFVGKVCVEFHFMEVVLFVFCIDGFSGHGAESMVVAFITFLKNSCAAG